MTAELSTPESTDQDAAGASFHGVTDWHAIDWRAVNHNVRRRASAYRQGNEGKEMGQGENPATPLNPLV